MNQPQANYRHQSCVRVNNGRTNLIKDISGGKNEKNPRKRASAFKANRKAN